MSGGWVVVLQRSGGEASRCELAEGLFTVGADPACDLRLLGLAPHHATIVVHDNQTVVRNVSEEGSTLVNGRCVSVAALRHGDVITLGDRNMRWEYSHPNNVRRQLAPDTGAHIHVCRRGGRGGRGGRVGRVGGAAGGRRSEGPRAPPRDRALQVALELRHRASMPGNSGGKQVAIVQPQRRHTNEQNGTSDQASPRSTQSNNRPRSSTARSDLDTSASECDHSADLSTRKSTPKLTTRGTASLNLQNTTKATQWIESRKTSPRKAGKGSPSRWSTSAIPRATLAASGVGQLARHSSGRRGGRGGGHGGTPLRVTALRNTAHSALKHKQRVTKIQAPLKIDHTKQVAIMLMTGHTPKSKQTSPKIAKTTPSYVIKKPSPVRNSAGRKSAGRKSAGRKSAGRRSKENATPANIEVTPRRTSSFSTGDTSRRSKRITQNQSVLEISDTTTGNTTVRESNISPRSAQNSSIKSPLLPNAKKSSLKDPANKKSTRKTESIKFDLSNLESQTEDSTDVLMLTDTRHTADYSASEDDLTLHFSDSSSTKSPSPRRSIHSRSSRILEQSIGTEGIPIVRLTRTLTPESPRSRKSLRGSIIVQKALETSDSVNGSRRTTKDNSKSTIASAFKTRTLSPRSPKDNMESYSIVDLVSIDSNGTRSSSVYGSVRSTNSSAFGTPANSTGRKTRSTIDPKLLGSSTPYVQIRSSLRSQSSPNVSRNSTRNSSSRRSKSLTTPENTRKNILVNSTRISRASRSRSRINDSDLLLISGDEIEGDYSPKTSKRISSRASKSQLSLHSANSSVNETTSKSLQVDGTITPENRQSPEDAGTPVLRIKSLLDASLNSTLRQMRKGTKSLNQTRATGATRSGISPLSKSLNITARKTRLRLSKESEDSCKTDEGAPQPDDEEVVTPKSAVKLIPEAVKNKHSTAKKPQSKRSIIDHLNESDIVKQLFNSPVKRKLSQSMTEFSRKRLFDDDDVPRKRPTRNTVTGATPDHSLIDHTESYTPELFVSPLNTPRTSPNLFGIKKLFEMNSPPNDLRNVRGVKTLLRTPRKSPKNDLTNVSGIKSVFAKSPKNRLSDVRVKELFAPGPKNDLRRVTGVKSVYQTRRNSPKNDLDDVRGVKRMFNRNSPKNDLSDVRGVRRMFREEKRKSEYDNMSGIEELFNESNTSYRDSESLFDQLIGKPPIKSVYSKTFTKKLTQKAKTRNAKSLHDSIDLITNNVEEWLEQELQKRLHKDDPSTSKLNKSKNTPKSNATRELQKLTTDTVEGSILRNSRVRTSTIAKSIISGDTSSKRSASEVYSAHTLPIKKRSLVDVSMGKSKNESRKYLPIKKRALVHSTPMKGRKSVTMNASELGRVSPIAAVDKTANVEHNTSIGSKQADELDPAPKGRRQTKGKIEEQKTEGSPKNTRDVKVISLANSRVMRNRTANVDSNSIKKRASLVITKKSPVKNPKPVKTAQESSAATPEKKQLRTRSQKTVKTTPKTTRAKVVKASVVVSKPSPILKPLKANTRQKIVPDKPKTTRGKKPEPIESPKESQNEAKGKTKAAAPKTEPKTRGRKAVIAEEDTEKPVQAKRGRKAEVVDDNTAQVSKRSGRTRGKKPESPESVQSEPVKGKTRGKKVVAESVEPEPKSSRTRGKKPDEPKPNITEVKTRGKKVAVQDNVQTEPPKRGRKAKLDNDELEVEPKGRKRKTVVVDVIPTKATRGSRKAIETTETTKGQKRSVVKDSKQSDVVQKVTKPVKSKSVASKALEAEAKPTRGRKTAVAKETIAKPTVSRKRKYNAEPSPTKEPAKKLPAARTRRNKPGGGTDADAGSPVRRTTRGKKAVTPVETKTAGRSRRR